MSGALIVLLAPLDHKQSDKNQHIKMVKKKTKNRKMERTRFPEARKHWTEKMLQQPPTCGLLKFEKTTTSLFILQAVSVLLFASECIPTLSWPSKNFQPGTEGGENSLEWKNFKESRGKTRTYPCSGDAGEKRHISTCKDVWTRELAGRRRQSGRVWSHVEIGKSTQG